MKIRHFIYADAKEIDSMYSQIFDDITEINTTVSRENKVGIEAEIKMPNILQGFLPGNFSGDYERDCNHTVSTQSHVSIEKKVMALLEHVSSGENDVIHRMGNNLLVVGRVEAMRYNQFLLKADELLQAEESLNFESFYEKYCEDSRFSSLWKKLAKKISLSERLKIPFGVSELFAMGRPEMGKIIVLNSDYPIAISFSCNKLLLSASEMANLERFSHAENLSILGLMRKVGNGFYSIKPVAMWEIFESEKVDERFMYQVRNFTKYWKKGN